MAGAADDAQLMARYATGDVSAFETLYARHKGPVYRYFFRQFSNPDTADELFQDVWIRIVKARERGERKVRFSTQLYQTAHNCLMDHFAASAPVAQAGRPIPEELDPAFASARWSLVDWEKEPADASSGPEAATSGEQGTSPLRSALDALSIEQREAFLLHEEAQFGLAEIIAVTGSRDAAELEDFLSRRSGLSADYDHLERVEPPASLDQKVLAAAKAVAKPAAPPAATQTAAAKPSPPKPIVATPMEGASSAIAASQVERRKRSRTPAPEVDDFDDDDDDDDDDADAASSRRPRWLVPAAVAASVLAIVGVGLTMLLSSPSGTSDTSLVGSLFAKRARERSEADKAAAAAAAAEQEAEVVVLDPVPPPPPPILEAGGPQVQDLGAAIALIRKELVMVNQKAAMAEEAAASEKQSAAPAGKVGDTAPAAQPGAAPDVVQPRERRLTKILELYDGGNPDLAADALEIFLRDFEDDPISRRILNVKP